MKKTFYIQPRQTGKTTKAVKEFLESPDENLLLVHNKHRANDLEKKYNINHKNIIGYVGEHIFHGRQINKLLIDEYLFFKDFQKLYRIITENSFYNEIKVYSTSNKKYDKRLLNIIKKYKDIFDYVTLFEICSFVFKEFNCDITIEIFNEHYNNFLSDSDCVIIDDEYEINESLNERCNYMEMYDVEFENKWFY